MADYSNITLISQIDDTIPANDEAANKLDDAERQIRNFLKTFLAVGHADNGALKDSSIALSAIPDTTLTYAKLQNVSATDKVLGRASAGAGVVEEIACTSAGRALIDDADAAAQRTTLGLGGLSILSTITSTQMGAASVLEAAIATDAVTTTKIKDANVTGTKLADTSVGVAKLSFTGGVDSNPKLMVGGSSNVEATIGGILSATYVSGVLTFALASAGSTPNYAVIGELKTAGTNAGSSSVGTGNTRGTWTEVSDPGDIVGVSSSVVTIRKKGNYIVNICVPAYSVGSHKAFLYQTSGTPATALDGTTACSGPGNMTHSYISGPLTVTTDNTTYEVRHWCEKAITSNGLGLAANNGISEYYTTFSILLVKTL